MTALSKAELKSAKDFSTSDDLNADITYAGDMRQTIKDFIDNSKDLVGDAWDKEKAQLSYYSDKLNKQMVIAKELSDVINRALNKLLNAIAPDETVKIDDKSINEIADQIDVCQDTIDRLRSELNSYITITDKTDTSKKKTVSLKEGNPQRYSEVDAQLSEQEDLLVELKRMQQKMVDLKKLADEVKKELDQAFSDITRYWNDDSALTLV